VVLAPVIGGNTGSTEEYNGSAWTTVPPGSMGTARIEVLQEQELKQQV
jgi:hypothetical protein